MSGQQQSFESIDIFEEDQNNFNMCEKFKAVLDKLKVPFLLLLLILVPCVAWITWGVKVTNMENEVDSYKQELTILKKLKHDSFHSRAASAEDCEELRNHGFSTSGYFLIGK